LPPVIRSINPVGGRNFTARRIFVEFDEYVQLKDLSKEFYTSPLMKTKPMPVIRGRSIMIDIKDTLLENQTYSLNFGNAIADNNEGNPLVDFRYVFSTGPAIDSLLMTGYTENAAKGDSLSKAYVFFFDAALDTIPEYDSILFKHQPKVVGRSQNNGIFIAQNLRDTLYKVYAFQDNNNNLKYDVGTDMVGFLDSLVNPIDMEPTSIWLDDYRRYSTAEPQTYFRLFGEEPLRRQNLNASERPGKHQVILRFAAPRPKIDTLSFEGIPDERIIREYMTPGRDTMTLWFDVAPEMMPDTLRGRISYRKPDSLGAVAPFSQDLKLAWRYVETKEEAKEREKEERDAERAAERGEEYTPPEKPNPFGFKVDASAEINPEKSIPIEFTIPLSSIDSARIRLETVPDLGDPVPVPFRVVQDTTNIRRWVVKADWDDELSYRMTIPEGVFVNVAGERNDSLGANFKIQRSADFTTLSVRVEGETPESRYIVELVDAGGKMLSEIRDASTGSYEFGYIAEGEVSIRITEDGNGNGKWDSGSLVERRQPERTEFWVNPTGDKVIAAKANLQMDITLDMSQIFAPVSIERIRENLRRAEDARVVKYLEDQAAKEEERRRQGTTDPNAVGGFGIGDAMGNARQQIGTIAQ
jgi:hypothetical protein